MLECLIIIAILFFVFGVDSVFDSIAEVAKIILGLLTRSMKSYWSIFAVSALVVLILFLWMRHRDKRMLEELKQGNCTKGGRWADARPYQGGLAPVKNHKGLWGFVNWEGKVVYKPQFNKISFYHREKGDFWLCWGIVEDHRSGECIATSGETLDAWDVQKELEGSCVYSEGEDVEDSSYFESSYLAESKPVVYERRDSDEEEKMTPDEMAFFMVGLKMLFFDRQENGGCNDGYEYGYDEDDEDDGYNDYDEADEDE